MFIFTDQNSVKGSDLSKDAQQEVLSSFMHRYTGTHKPNWASILRENGQPYPVQFKDDQDWLENTRFAITKQGNLNNKVDHCYSTPTWPKGKE